MSRKCIPRSLPSLPEIFSSFSGFVENSNKQRVLLHELRKVAKRLKKKKSQPFYSMREVSDFFQAPLRTVAIAYETLESEGLLNRIRSSHTLLVGSAESTQNMVRGVVGIPIWLHAMVVSPYTRVLHIELEERLRKNGFIADFIFFRTGEDCQPDFSERLLRHNLNFLIWHTPHPLAAHVHLSMQDHGVRQLIIQATESQGSQLQPNYLLNWRPAYETMAESWIGVGIKRVLVPKPEYLPSQRALTSFCKQLTGHGMEVELIEGAASTLLKRIGNGASTAVAFMDHQGADTICNEEPEIIQELIRRSRVAFCRGPLRLPYFQHRPAKVDIVGFSPTDLADHIVTDLCQPAEDQSDEPYVFEATYHCQEPLNGSFEPL